MKYEYIYIFEYNMLTVVQMCVSVSHCKGFQYTQEGRERVLTLPRWWSGC